MPDETGEGAEGAEVQLAPKQAGEGAEVAEVQLTVQLASGTFRTCGVTSKWLEGSELIAIADAIDPVFRQTVLPFCWATGARAQEDVTKDAVDQFCAVMQQVDRRLGTHLGHLKITVEDAIALAKQSGACPRHPSTMMRHRSRLARIRDFSRPRFAARLRAPGWVQLEPAEIASLGSHAAHRGFIFVECLGKIRVSMPLQTFDLMMQTSSSAKALAPVLVQEAAQVVAAVEQYGQAFVATRHDDRALLIKGFWDAL